MLSNKYVYTKKKLCVRVGSRVSVRVHDRVSARAWGHMIVRDHIRVCVGVRGCGRVRDSASMSLSAF